MNQPEFMAFTTHAYGFGKLVHNLLPLRVLTLGNANAKCKGHLAFAALKTLASENYKQQYCKVFCTATVQF